MSAQSGAHCPLPMPSSEALNGGLEILKTAYLRQPVAACTQPFLRLYGRLDGLVHAIAFAPTRDLNGEFVDITRQGYLQTLDVSAYSLIALTRLSDPSASLRRLAESGTSRVR